MSALFTLHQIAMAEVAERGGVADENCSSTTPVRTPNSQSQLSASCVSHTAVSSALESSAAEWDRTDVEPSVGFPSLGQRVDPSLRVTKDSKPYSSFFACTNQLSCDDEGLLSAFVQDSQEAGAL